MEIKVGKRTFVLPFGGVDFNALNPTTNINNYIDLVNKSDSNTINPEVFYSKQLLDTIRLGADQYCYYRYADNVPIQEKADKLTMRRWSPLFAHTTPLVEGVPPQSDKGSVEKYEIQAYQYGRYMEFTDKVDFKAVDPIVAHYSAQYAIVAVETLDALARNELLRVSQKYFAGMVADITDLTTKSKPSIADLRVIALTLKKGLVKPRSNGKYHVLCSPEFIFDMLDDPYVQKYMQYNQTTQPLYDGAALIPMFGFEFYEVLNCPETSEHMDEAGKYSIIVYRTAPTGSTTYTIAGETLAAANAKADGNVYAVLPESYSGTTYRTSTAGYLKDSRTGEDGTYDPAHIGWTIPDGWKALKIQHTIILGNEALIKTGLSGQDSAKTIVKPLGSSGVLDPIDQRQSIGFKINNVGFGSTRPEAVIDYMNVPTQLNV